MKEKLNLKNLKELSLGALKGIGAVSIINYGANYLAEYRSKIQVQENVVFLKDLISKNKYVDSIALEDKNGNAFCSGTGFRPESLYAEKYVLTIRHCLPTDSKIELKALSNPYNYNAEIKSIDSVVLVTVKELRKNGIDVSNYSFKAKSENEIEGVYFTGRVNTLDQNNPFCEIDSVDFNKVINNGIRVQESDKKPKHIWKATKPGNSGSLITQYSKSMGDTECIVGLVEGNNFDKPLNQVEKNTEVTMTPRIFAINNNEFQSVILPKYSIKSTLDKQSKDD